MVYIVLMGLFPELPTLCEVSGWVDGWMDGASPSLPAEKQFKVHCQVSVESSTKMTLCMTQLLRAFTGDQIVGYFSLQRVKNCFLLVS